MSVKRIKPCLNVLFFVFVCQFGALIHANESGSVPPTQVDNIKLKLDQIINKGGGSDGGGFKYKYTAMPHFLRNKKYLLKVLLNTPQEKFDQFAQQYNIMLSREKFVHIIEEMMVLPALNYSRLNPDGIVEPLTMAYDLSEEKIYAFGAFFESFNKKTLSEEENAEMIIQMVHEASHIFKIGINSDDENSRKFAIDFYDQIVRAYQNDCGLSGSVEDRFRMCGKVKIGSWKLVGRLSKKAADLYYNEQNNIWLSNLSINRGLSYEQFREQCSQISNQFNTPLDLPLAQDLEVIFREDSVFKKYIGNEIYYDFIKKYSDKMVPFAVQSFYLNYTTPENECFPTQKSNFYICKNGETKKMSELRAIKMTCLAK